MKKTKFVTPLFENYMYLNVDAVIKIYDQYGYTFKFEYKQREKKIYLLGRYAKFKNAEFMLADGQKWDELEITVEYFEKTGGC